MSYDPCKFHNFRIDCNFISFDQKNFHNEAIEDTHLIPLRDFHKVIFCEDHFEINVIKEKFYFTYKFDYIGANRAVIEAKIRNAFSKLE